MKSVTIQIIYVSEALGFKVDLILRFTGIGRLEKDMGGHNMQVKKTKTKILSFLLAAALIISLLPVGLSQTTAVYAEEISQTEQMSEEAINEEENADTDLELVIAEDAELKGESFTVDCQSEEKGTTDSYVTDTANEGFYVSGVSVNGMELNMPTGIQDDADTTIGDVTYTVELYYENGKYKAKVSGENLEEKDVKFAHSPIQTYALSYSTDDNGSITSWRLTGDSNYDKTVDNSDIIHIYDAIGGNPDITPPYLGGFDKGINAPNTDEYQSERNADVNQKGSVDSNDYVELVDGLAHKANFGIYDWEVTDKPNDGYYVSRITVNGKDLQIPQEGAEESYAETTIDGITYIVTLDTNGEVMAKGPSLAENTVVFAHSIKTSEHSYRFTKGDGSTWTKDLAVPLDFTVKRSVDDETSFDRFTGIKIDGVEVENTNYTAKSGSVELSLNAAYLQNLSVGAHTIEAIFNDGSATAAFNVKEAAKPDTKGDDNKASGGSSNKTTATGSTVTSGGKAATVAAKTGNGYALEIWTMLLAMAGAGLIIVLLARKRKHR